MENRLQELRARSAGELPRIFDQWLPDSALETLDKPGRRERLFGPRSTFWAFLSQSLNPGASCLETVRELQAAAGRGRRGGTDSAYCQARRKLRDEDLEAINRSLRDRMEAAAPSSRLWRGRHVRMVDGTGLAMADTEENQSLYPQPSEQRIGCGFPVMKLVASFSLQTGAMEDWRELPLKSHESRCLADLASEWNEGDVALTDRGFSSYGNIAALLQRGCDSVMRAHQARKIDLRRGERLGPSDRLLVWRKPQRPKDIPRESWEALPDRIEIRALSYEVRAPGFRTRKVTLVTTLTDPTAFPKEALADLYLRRWSVELRLRDVKTSMGAETLRCRTPEMVRKELRMFVIAHNLLRALMLESLGTTQTALERISFKAAADTVRQFRRRFASAGASKARIRQARLCLLEAIAEGTIPERPGRAEPRAVKRRPKPYQKLTLPRRMMKVSKSRRAYVPKSRRPA